MPPISGDVCFRPAGLWSKQLYSRLEQIFRILLYVQSLVFIFGDTSLL